MVYLPVCPICVSLSLYLKISDFIAANFFETQITKYCPVFEIPQGKSVGLQADCCCMLQTLGNVRGIANSMPVVVKLVFVKLLSVDNYRSTYGSEHWFNSIYLFLISRFKTLIVHLQTVKPIVQDCCKLNWSLIHCSFSIFLKSLACIVLEAFCNLISMEDIIMESVENMNGNLSQKIMSCKGSHDENQPVSSKVLPKHFYSRDMLIKLKNHPSSKEKPLIFDDQDRVKNGMWDPEHWHNRTAKETKRSNTGPAVGAGNKEDQQDKVIIQNFNSLIIVY